jgi:1-pyrroline-5-carboxylate dehydrogenase
MTKPLVDSAMIGQQPFGDSRASGTNDKAGTLLNRVRWVSPRTIKETFVPATDYRYPFMESEGSTEAEAE